MHGGGHHDARDTIGYRQSVIATAEGGDRPGLIPPGPAGPEVPLVGAAANLLSDLAPVQDDIGGCNGAGARRIGGPAQNLRRVVLFHHQAQGAEAAGQPSAVPRRRGCRRPPGSQRSPPGGPAECAQPYPPPPSQIFSD